MMCETIKYFGYMESHVVVTRYTRCALWLITSLMEMHFANLRIKKEYVLLHQMTETFPAQCRTNAGGIVSGKCLRVLCKTESLFITYSRNTLETSIAGIK